MDDIRKLACGHFWTRKTPQRCGLCDKCAKCCACDNDGRREAAAKVIREQVKQLTQEE